MTRTEICQHLQTGIGYLWDDEQQDFEARRSGEPGPHIFESLVVLNQWLEEQAQAIGD